MHTAFLWHGFFSFQGTRLVFPSSSSRNRVFLFPFVSSSSDAASSFKTHSCYSSPFSSHISTLLLLFPLLLLVPFEFPYLIQFCMSGSLCLPLVLLVTYLAYSSTLKMEVARSTETWVKLNWDTQLTSQKLCRGLLKSTVLFLPRTCSPVA